jgi:hypothetical protein
MEKRTNITIEEMVEGIERFGHRGVWLGIEKIKDPIERLQLRAIFFSAGGTFGENKNE